MKNVMVWIIVSFFSIFLHAEDTNQFLRVPIQIPSVDSGIEFLVDSEKLFAASKNNINYNNAHGACRSPAGFEYSGSEIAVQSCQNDYNRIYLPSGFKPEPFCSDGDCSFDDPFDWVDVFL